MIIKQDVFSFSIHLNIFFLYIPPTTTNRTEPIKRILKDNIYLDKGCTFSVCLSPSFEDECIKPGKFNIIMEVRREIEFWRSCKLFIEVLLFVFLFFERTFLVDLNSLYAHLDNMMSTDVKELLMVILKLHIYYLRIFLPAYAELCFNNLLVLFGNSDDFRLTFKTSTS